MKNKLICASVAALAFGAGPAHALVDVAVSYDSLGLGSARYLVSDSQQRTDAEAVALNQNDLAPPPDGQRIGGFLRAAASASRYGELDTNSWLATGGYASSTASWSESVHNTGVTARSYSLALSLSSMELGLGGWSADYSTRDFRAGFEVDVSVNGASVWHAGRSLSQSAAGVRAASHGQQLGAESLQIASSAGGYSSYGIGNYSTEVDLGTFAGGAGFNVVYTLRGLTLSRAVRRSSSHLSRSIPQV